MNNRQRFTAVLNYEGYDRLPVVHFGCWKELLEKWVREGHLTEDEITGVKDGNEKDRHIMGKLGFDFNYFITYQDRSGFDTLYPIFEAKRLKDNPDGSYEYLDKYGAIVLQKEGVVSIPAEIGHTLVDRASWEEHFLWRLQYDDSRFDDLMLKKLADDSEKRTEPLGMYCHSMYGQMRNWLGVVGISYLQYDDEELYDEIIDTVGTLAYNVTRHALEAGVKFDFAHFWEDICYKNGSIIDPSVIDRKAGPHYRKITDLLKEYGVEIVSVDCDGMIDSLIPIWLDNGVNTMFPIEVGTWGASIAPWREKYGKKIRGVGGLNKHVMSYDKNAIEAEIERMKPLVDLGGFLPCPDHRLPPDTKWELVQYYCDRMRRVFG